MPSYLQQLRASKEKPIVAYQEFALSTNTYSDHLFCFFEGNDNPYYVPRIKNFTKKIFPINCGGREKVLKVFELIKNQDIYNKYLKAFFIDRDFNSPLTDNKDLIFETPSYSIENLYVNKKTFEEILIHEFQLSQNDSNFQVCASLFDERFQEFNEAVALFNSWYACLIAIRNEQKIETGVQLDEKFPKGFISVTLKGITSNYDMEKIIQTFPKANTIEEEVVLNKLEEFKKCDCELIFRGKYQLDFFISLLQLIVDDSKNAKEIIDEKINFTFDGSLNHKRALSIFTHYAQTPQSLNEFLNTVISNNNV